MPLEDRTFGRILVDLELATAEQVAVALARQAQLAVAGERRRLGVLLVEDGVLSPELVREALERQGKILMVCRGCGRSYNVVGRQSNVKSLCPECRIPMERLGLAAVFEADLKAAGTAVLSPLPVPETRGLPGRPPSTMVSPAEAQRHPPPAAIAGRPFGRYRLLDLVGTGGMGCVWKAWDTELQRMVALKQIREDKAGCTDDRLRFQREARLAARLRHPGILTVHDVGEAEGRSYLTMDFVEGQTFAAWLDQVPPGPERLRVGVRILADVASAIAHSHSHGVIHRDLKPPNVLLDGQLRAFVTDFGLGREIEPPSGRPRLTVTGEVLGTPAYMSPEQAMGDGSRIGPPTDIWAAGIMLYEVLVGTTPFETPGRHGWDVLHAAYAEDPAPPRKRNPAVPAELEAVCLKAIEKDPGPRYASMAEFAAELERWRRGEPVLARPLGIGARLWRRARRRRIPLASATVLAAAMALAWYFSRLAAGLQEEVLTQLREAARVCVDETLHARRKGDLEPRARLRARLEDACRRAEQRLSSPSPEPPYLLGRMLRACLEEGAARAAQERAIAIDPGFAPALYERAVLDSRVWQRMLSVSRGEALARLGPDGPARVPDDTEIERRDEHLRAARARMMEGVAHLCEALDRSPVWGRHPEPLLRVDESRLACVTGLTSTDPDSARRSLEAALAGDPRLEEACEALAGLALRAHRWEEAIAACSRGIETDRGYVPFRQIRGDARTSSGISRWLAGEDGSGPFADAVDDFTKAIELEPDRSESWEGRAVARAASAVARKDRGGDPAETFAAAVADFDRARELSPDRSRILGRRALVRLNWVLWRKRRGEDPAGLYDAALADLDRAAAVSPDKPEPWLHRGVLHMNLGTLAKDRGGDPLPEYRAAIEDLDRALARDPTDPFAWSHRGQARMNWATWFQLGGGDPGEQMRAAIADFDSARELDPQDFRPWKNRATAHFILGVWRMTTRLEDPMEDFDTALRDYDEALARNPADADGWRQRGVLRRNWAEYLISRGLDPSVQHSLSVAEFGHAIALDPAGAEAVRDRGLARLHWGLWRLGQGGECRELLDAAIADLEESLRRNGEQPKVREDLAQARAARAKAPK